MKLQIETDSQQGGQMHRQQDKNKTNGQGRQNKMNNMLANNDTLLIS